jgi:glycosyltransferase involved in cell wall biosynthesis
MAAVSIIIPTYNRSSLLKECVNSLLKQTYSDIEIIVVDDGSTDDTQTAITELKQKHDNIRYYPRPHLCAPAARNFGLTKATGEFIGFFDSDDLWPPDYIETMVKALKTRPDFGAVYSRIMQYRDSKIVGQYGTMANPPSGYITTALFSGKPFILPSSAIFRKNSWAGMLWDEVLKNRQDFDMFLRISTSIKFMYIPDTCAIHRKHHNSISVTAGKSIFDDGPRVMERFYFRLDGKSHVPKKLALRLLSHRYRHFAMRNFRAGNRAVSIAMLKRAITYYPFDLRLYVDLFQVFLSNPKNDKMPDWQMSPALSPVINKNDCLHCI